MEFVLQDSKPITSFTTLTLQRVGRETSVLPLPSLSECALLNLLEAYTGTSNILHEAKLFFYFLILQTTALHLSAVDLAFRYQLVFYPP
jgi:hypothetical protein